jgi:hypothetical protein
LRWGYVRPRAADIATRAGIRGEVRAAWFPVYHLLTNDLLTLFPRGGDRTLLQAMSIAADSVRPYAASTADEHCRHHLLIAGTGRAGTSALVKYLAALGLETHLAKRGNPDWNVSAEAGLEDLPAFAATDDLPYVIKSPWSHQMITQVLANPGIKLDAVLVPIRDLLEAATSRSVVQLQAVHQGAPWMTQMTTWEQWGETPGGAIYSLDPVDQARLLAVGFHRLLQQAASAEIPIVLLSFPRFAVDPDYLFRQLSSVLPVDVSVARAQEAHAATFRPAKIRVVREVAPGMRQARSAGEAADPRFTALDNAALKREVERLRDELGAMRDELGALQKSTSWRLTAPIRVILDGIRRSMRGLAKRPAGKTWQDAGLNAAHELSCRP